VSSITIVNPTQQFGASVTVIIYAPRVISYAPNIFITQATDVSKKGIFSVPTIVYFAKNCQITTVKSFTGQAPGGTGVGEWICD
jgi:hypothetical protein